MATVIQNQIEHALGDGARAAKFTCGVVLPANRFKDVTALNTLVKTSSFPGKTIELSTIKYKGRDIPVKGQVKYQQSWECTFYMTESHDLKIAFETWMEAIDQKHNYGDYSSDDPNEIKQMKENIKKLKQYTETLGITQYNFDLDKPAVEYTLHNCFPISISSVEVNSESVGQLQEFTVTFAYTYYTNKINKDLDKLNAVDKFKKDVTKLAKDSINNLTENITTSLETKISPANTLLEEKSKSLIDGVPDSPDDFGMSMFKSKDK